MKRQESQLEECRLLTIKKTAELLMISRDSIYKLIYSGELPTIRVGRSRRIPVRDLRAWLEEKRSSQAHGSQGQSSDLTVF